MALCGGALALAAAAMPSMSSAIQVGLSAQIPPLVFDAKGASSIPAGWHAGSFLSGVVIGVMSTLVVVGFLLDRRKALAACERQPEPKPAAASPSEGSDGPEASESSPVPKAHSTRQRATGPPPALSSAWRAPEDADSTPGESIHLFWPRCGFLVAMLMVQSVSSLILSGFHDLIRNHASLVYFLTMLVGLGGNAGGQSVVLAVRRLAVGHQVQIREQLLKGLLLGLVIGPLGTLRAWASGTSLPMMLTIGLSCVLITTIATTCGTAIPMVLSEVKVDPAHAASVIQVLMDIAGIIVVCCTGVWIVSALGK